MAQPKIDNTSLDIMSGIEWLDAKPPKTPRQADAEEELRQDVEVIMELAQRAIDFAIAEASFQMEAICRGRANVLELDIIKFILKKPMREYRTETKTAVIRHLAGYGCQARWVSDFPLEIDWSVECG